MKKILTTNMLSLLFLRLFFFYIKIWKLIFSYIKFFYKLPVANTIEVLFKKKSIGLCTSLLIITASIYSQGLVENDLTTNQILVKNWNQNKLMSDIRMTSTMDTINLDTIKGFLDDFSYNSTYPDTSLWVDNQVFVNRSYAKSPKTIGTATFDGLNANGYPYDFFVSPTSSNSADSLTSKPINLLNYLNNGTPVNYQISDSIYFSFYFQAQGHGNAPDLNDSLVLEFKIPEISTWKHIWSVKGQSLASNDSSWQIVMVPIKDIQLLKKGFQFRFRNYATISGNLDHWNIDYVYLNKYRTMADTIFEDLSFVYNSSSLLNTYTQMPWKHYNSGFMKTALHNLLRNNYSLQKNVNFSYKVYDQLGTTLTSSLVSSDNVFPFSQIGYYDYISNPLPILPLLTDTSSFTFESVLSTNPDKHKNNDTLRHKQNFFNAYAYDDGSAESSFGLSTLNAQMAEKFQSTIADTLRCIDIYFNPVLTNANLYAFSLNVWDDNGGKPGNAIYTSDSVLIPLYAQTKQDQFIHYYLYPPLYLNASTFFIGFTQKTTQFLNVGVDKNTNTQNNIYYNVIGEWNNSPFPGSLMMHPVFGIADYYAGIYSAMKDENNSISVFPNPTIDKLYLFKKKDQEIENRDQLTINIELEKKSMPEKITYSIIDIFGKLLQENSSCNLEFIDVSDLSEGIYFIRIVEGLNVSTSKFIKVK